MATIQSINKQEIFGGFITRNLQKVWFTYIAEVRKDINVMSVDQRLCKH